MIPPTTTGASTPSARSSRTTWGTSVEVAAGEDRQADDVGILVTGRRRDLLGREADARVHDLHARVTGRDGDLLGPVRMAVEPGLGDEQPRRAAGHGPDPRRDFFAALHRAGEPPTAAPTPVGARYSPNTSRSAPAHSPVVPPAWARAMVAGTRFSPLSAHAPQLVDRLGHASARRVPPPGVDVGDQLLLDRGSTTRMLPLAAERRRLPSR